jgi:hypothetical protein
MAAAVEEISASSNSGSIKITAEYSSIAGIEEDYSQISIYSKLDSSISSKDEESIKSSIEASYAGASGKVEAEYGRIKSKASSTSATNSTSSTTKVKFDPSKYQVYRTVTSTFVFPGGGFAEGSDRVHVRTSDESSTEQDLYEMSCDYMQTHYGTPSHELIVQFIEAKYKKWVPISRGDLIPESAIYGGTFSGDGALYVGRFNGTPGKINLKDNRMWNCWVQGQGSSTHAEILTTNMDVDWINYTKGDAVPENSVGNMQTDVDGPVIVARTNSGEIGKLNLNNGMTANLWSQGTGKSTSGQIPALT